ncbi:hypothetical protein EP227_01065 [bacterium]|nr:MAG: hypothetical protein EP227_01065 [bacterium]
MKKRYIRSLVILICMLFLYSCGGSGTGGAPGSSGSEDTGIVIQHIDIIGNDDTPEDIDVANHICPDGEIEPINALHREDATMTIQAALVNEGFDAFPASVENCTITYRKSNDDPAAPIIETWTVYPNCIIAEGENNCVINLIDIQRKVDFWDDITSSQFIPNNAATRYVATYSCRYMNNFREDGRFQIEYEIFLWDFETCA